MRSIGQLNDEGQAGVLSDYLYARGIDNQVESSPDGLCTIWALDEDQVPEAEKILREFLADPARDAFREGAAGAANRRREEARQRRARATVYRRYDLWSIPYGGGAGPVTLALIGISIAVGLITLLGSNQATTPWFLISNYVPRGNTPWWQALIEIRHGQLWRLISPAFLHFGFLHILFNLMWTKDLGTTIETRKGSAFLALMFFAIAIPSNLAQYAVTGPMFGGMSGVVYGLLGYVWMKGKYDPGTGMQLHPTTVTMMIVWFALGWTGLMRSANLVHTVGLAIGTLWGYASSVWFRR